VKIDDTVNTRLNVFARLSQRKQNDLVPGNIPGASGGAARADAAIADNSVAAR